MKHISILVPNGNAVLSSVIGPYKIFNSVNEHLINTGQANAPVFDVKLVGLNSGTELYGGAFSIRTDHTIDEIEKTDLIIIPALIGDIGEELRKNFAFIPWIREQRAKHNTEVASLCMGAFLLAETGLVNGKACSTHWLGAEQFKSLYPKVNLIPEKVITEDDGIYSSGGAYSFLNLILHLVEKYAGREATIWCSKLFEIEIDRVSQSQFTIFRGQKEHDDEPIKKAQLYIEDNFGEKISVEYLAEMFAISRRNFVRRFKKATANTPSEYIQRVKIEAAKKSLESTSENVTEVMYQVGYSDTKAFRNLFRKLTGLSPLEYRNKYNRHVAVA